MLSLIPRITGLTLSLLLGFVACVLLFAAILVALVVFGPVQHHNTHCQGPSPTQLHCTSGP